MTEIHRAAVFGKPIAHSLSPVIHNAGYAAAGLTGWAYTAVECAESELAGRVAALGPEWAGLSLTMPLKEVALSVAAAVSPVAAAVGAANTLVRRADGSWYADNTDVPGMVDVLAGIPGDARFTVLGAGGTARAAIAAAAQMGAAGVTVVARRPEAVEELRPVAEAVGVPFAGVPWSDAATYAEADVVVATVPKGVADPLAVTVRWRPSTVLFEALYDPWPTPWPPPPRRPAAGWSPARTCCWPRRSASGNFSRAGPGSA
ncbi:shikimate 5-dehydrogenase [Phytohabitans rumicis]|uniref:Shikimate 5-dehydrogenase n=1 Tax=Phytohabitans rumicis TaxID=1076125 RepID=A0A6V8KXC3_9ACTN|nr:shikimate 5-dehydrogenase [Phytohabitans rumicis]